MKEKPHRKTDQRPIGVFDSGLGGLTVVREIRRQLPYESVSYFGDLARVPYGIKSREQILNFSIQNTLFLLKKKIKALVIACNSSSSAAYRFLKNHFDLPVVDAVTPAVERACEVSRTGRIGLIATQATVESGFYEKALDSINRKAKMVAAPCPLFVPLVEEGLLRDAVTETIARKYLKPLMQKKIDTLILGCTHYPLLKSVIRRVIGPKIKIVDSALPAVRELRRLLMKEKLETSLKKKGQLSIYVSDKPRNFKVIGEKFLNEKMKSVEVIREKQLLSSG